jgi:hypothetical protein
MDSEQFDAALVRSRAVAAVAGADIQRNLTIKISKMQENIARMPQGAARMAAEETLQNTKMRLAVANERAITALTIAEVERRTAAEIEAATRSNRARALLRTRAATRLNNAIAAEQDATGLLGWWSGDKAKATAAAATAERVAAQARLASLTSTAAAAAHVANNMKMAHAAGLNFTVASREALVILREIGRGNWARVPGSISIMAQNLGLGLIKVLTSVPGLVVIAAGAIGYFTLKHIKTLNEQLDRTAKLMSEAFGDRSKSNAEAFKDSARAAADFNSWLQKLGISYDDLAQKTDLELAKLREQFQLMRELARLKGSSDTDERAAEQKQRREELALLETNLKKAKEQVEADKKTAAAANEDAFTGKDALDRKARLLDMPSQMADVEKNIPKFKEFVEQLQTKVDSMNEDSVNAIRLSNRESIFGLDPQQLRAAEDAAKAKNADTMMAVGPKGQEIQISLNQAIQELKSYQALKTSLPQEQARLEQVQRSLEDAQKEAKSRGETDSKAVETLTKERDSLQGQIALHEKYDPLLNAAANERQQAKNMSGGMNADQKVGAYSAVPSDLAKLVKHVAKIESNTAHLNPPAHPPVGKEKPSYGGIHH